MQATEKHAPQAIAVSSGSSTNLEVARRNFLRRSIDGAKAIGLFSGFMGIYLPVLALTHIPANIRQRHARRRTIERTEWNQSMTFESRWTKIVNHKGPLYWRFEEPESVSCIDFRYLGKIKPLLTSTVSSDEFILGAGRLTGDMEKVEFLQKNLRLHRSKPYDVRHNLDHRPAIELASMFRRVIVFTSCRSSGEWREYQAFPDPVEI